MYEGYVGAEPVIQTFERGDDITVVASFNLCVNAGYMKDEQWQDKSFWMRVRVPNRLVEHVKRLVTKGTGLIVEGKLSKDIWENKETGEENSMLICNASRIGLSLRPIESFEKRTSTSGNGQLTEEPDLTLDEEIPF